MWPSTVVQTTLSCDSVCVTNLVNLFFARRINSSQTNRQTACTLSSSWSCSTVLARLRAPNRFSRIPTKLNEKKRSERRKHCSRKIFVPPQFPGVQDRQNLISWRWSLPASTDPVWWRSMHAISSYRGNRHRPPQTLSARCKHRTPARHKHTQTGPITIHCAASPLPNLDSHNQYLHLATFNIPYQHIILDSGPYIHCLPFTIFNILCTLETFYHFAIE